MNPMQWFLVVVLILAIILTVFGILLSRKEKRPTDFYAFYIIGAIWLAIGIPLTNIILIGIGTIFMIMSLLNKHKWKANIQTWQILTQREQFVRLFVVLILGLMVFFGLLFFVRAGT